MRRRRTRHTWFPIIGGDGGGDEGDPIYSTVTRALAVPADGGATNAFDIIPVIPDEAREEPGVDDQLVDFIGTNWLIARLVGKIHLSYQQVPIEVGAEGPPPAVLVTAGFLVARQDGTNPAGPIGATAELEEDYGPLVAKTMREPWMWRRSWILGNNAGLVNDTSGAFAVGQFFPATNSARSVADGPHIDCKVKRRSSNDERLFFAIQAAAYPPDGTALGNIPGLVSYTLDLRVLGSLRKQRNRSAF